MREKTTAFGCNFDTFYLRTLLNLPTKITHNQKKRRMVELKRDQVIIPTIYLP